MINRLLKLIRTFLTSLVSEFQQNGVARFVRATLAGQSIFASEKGAQWTNKKWRPHFHAPACECPTDKKAPVHPLSCE